MLVMCLITSASHGLAFKTALPSSRRATPLSAGRRSAAGAAGPQGSAKRGAQARHLRRGLQEAHGPRRRLRVPRQPGRVSRLGAGGFGPARRGAAGIGAPPRRRGRGSKRSRCARAVLECASAVAFGLFTASWTSGLLD